MADPAATTVPKIQAKTPPALPVDEKKALPKKLNGAKLAKFFRDSAALLHVEAFFRSPEIRLDVLDEQVERTRFVRAARRLKWQTGCLVFLSCCLAIGAPFFKPITLFYSVTPEGQVELMVPLDLPNLTDPAVVSWAATSATEVLSFGFGDIEAKTLLQKKRFTSTGWDAFVAAFFKTKVIETFRANQMVMTTVPIDTPVILSQGVNDDGVYNWLVDVPIITTYAANNNAIRVERSSVQMTIVRVPYERSPSGIAIDVWRQAKT